MLQYKIKRHACVYRHFTASNDLAHQAGLALLSVSFLRAEKTEMRAL